MKGDGSNSNYTSDEEENKKMKDSKLDLRKEYSRHCKVYNSEPLDIVGSPLEKANFGDENTIVDLKGRGLRGVDCIAIGKMLSSNAPIYHLNLSDCLLLPQGFQTLLDELCKNKLLKSLELRGNNIQSNMTCSLGAFVRSNHTLKKLVLEWNSLGTCKEDFKEFADGLALNQGIEELDLRNNQISDESTVDLANALKHNTVMTEVDLRWNSVGVVGAKALWDVLQQPTSAILKLHLSGNFIPEEITKYIEHCLEKKRERINLVQDYSQRTTMLTRQLQKSENQFQTELQKMIHVFDTEEAEFRKLIEEREAHIISLDKQLGEECEKTKELQNEIEKLNSYLEDCEKREKNLQNALYLKEEEFQNAEKDKKESIDKLRTYYESKLSVLREEIEGNKIEKDAFEAKISRLNTELRERSENTAHANERVEAMKKSVDEMKAFYEDKLREEKEKWNNWKEELETTEKKEIQTLESQISEMQSALTEHIKVLERGKTDAEEEVRRLKISYVTVKTEAEENLSRLRENINEENEKAVKNIRVQLETLQEKNASLEQQLQTQDAIARKLESETVSLRRHNENLRQQVFNLTEEANEKDKITQIALTRAKNEVKEQMEVLAKEEEANKILRAQVLELQQQLATLTLSKTREIQEMEADMEKFKNRIERREEELNRLKEEDMRRAGLLHEAFLAYMRSTSAATGIPLPPSFYNSAFPCQSGDGPQINPADNSKLQKSKDQSQPRK